MGTIKVAYQEVACSLDIDPEARSADSGDIAVDVPNWFVAVAEAAQDRRTAVALLIDEIQYSSARELGALMLAMHRIQQRRLPLALLSAGLPIPPALAGESKSHAERLFSCPNVGALAAEDSARALLDPARAAGVAFRPEALDEIYRLTTGYPYFIQEWGYQAWNHAPIPDLTMDTVVTATPIVLERLDANFVRGRFDRLTPSGKRFLRAMAELGPEAHRIARIAAALKVKVSSLGPSRAQLIAKGMICSPAHGDLAFTVPLFDPFIRRAIPQGGRA